jgi:hypothetical protein
MPRLIIAGTVMRDVLPATTLRTLVRKKKALRIHMSVVDINGAQLCQRLAGRPIPFGGEIDDETVRSAVYSRF